MDDNPSSAPFLQQARSLNCFASLAQLVERLPSKQNVISSNLIWCSKMQVPWMSRDRGSNLLYGYEERTNCESREPATEPTCPRLKPCKWRS